MPFNPLALLLYRTRKAALQARVEAGTLSRDDAALMLTEYAASLFRRRGKPREIPPPET